MSIKLGVPYLATLIKKDYSVFNQPFYKKAGTFLVLNYDIIIDYLQIAKSTFTMESTSDSRVNDLLAIEDKNNNFFYFGVITNVDGTMIECDFINSLIDIKIRVVNESWLIPNPLSVDGENYYVLPSGTSVETLLENNLIRYFIADPEGEDLDDPVRRIPNLIINKITETFTELRILASKGGDIQMSELLSSFFTHHNIKTNFSIDLENLNFIIDIDATSNVPKQLEFKEPHVFNIVITENKVNDTVVDFYTEKAGSPIATLLRTSIFLLKDGTTTADPNDVNRILKIKNVVDSNLERTSSDFLEQGDNKLAGQEIGVDLECDILIDNKVLDLSQIDLGDKIELWIDGVLFFETRITSFQINNENLMKLKFGIVRTELTAWLEAIEKTTKQRKL